MQQEVQGHLSKLRGMPCNTDITEQVSLIWRIKLTSTLGDKSKILPYCFSDSVHKNK